MPQECFLMMVPFPSHKQEKRFNHKLNLAIGETVDSPHVTLGDRFRANQDTVSNKLEDYLRVQDSFNLSFDKLDFYKQFVLLKPSDETMIEKTRELFTGILETVGGRLEVNQKLTPHITLLRSPFFDPYVVREKIKKVFTEPVLIPVNSVMLFKMMVSGGWGKVNEFKIGTCTSVPEVPEISEEYRI